MQHRQPFNSNLKRNSDGRKTVIPLTSEIKSIQQTPTPHVKPNEVSRMDGERARPGPPQRNDRESRCAQLVLATAVARSTIDFVCGVPDSLLSRSLSYLSARNHIHYLPREDAAVAAAVGASLNGRHPLVFMKNAGLGNALDAFTSLAVSHSIPLAVVVGWAGSGSDQLPHHVVWGDRTVAVVAAVTDQYMALDETAAGVEETLRFYFDEGFKANQLRFLLVRPQ